ncbi:MAG TPA: M56 family metallopeptidase, partial [Thermoguttaceae bacterium]|nr:M56 family metallopeptidase [Thermoguttaceae bacterium]
MLFGWLSGSLAESLCLALLHSLWQGAAWGVLLLLVLRRIPDDRPRVRYVVALGCLYGLLGGACLTWSILRHEATLVDDWTPPMAAAVEMGTPKVIEGGEASAPSVNGAAAPLPFRFADSVPWVIGAWFLGASICLLLSSRHVAAARRLRLGQPIDDSDIRLLLDRLISSFGLSRPIRLLSVEGLLQPGVVGALKPAILIPASLVTGLTPDQWEAILAHELAHIRRWDYLVNLSQLVIESLLFFNPAVWWLSRQVNLEREACCDASAVQLTARPVQYATLLVDLAQRHQLGIAAPTVGFSRDQSGSLLERVRRIVTPGRRSELTIRRPMAISFLVLSLVAVGLLQVGTDIAVAVAANILSDEERVETLVESAKSVDETAPGLGAKGEKLRISGVISVEGDEVPTAPVWIYEKRREASGLTLRTVCRVDLAQGPEFDVAVGPGISWLLFSHPDFAEKIIGPYASDDRPSLSDVRVALERGIDIPVTVMGDDGTPVADALVRR